jgi:hypothetical protein
VRPLRNLAVASLGAGRSVGHAARRLPELRTFRRLPTLARSLAPAAIRELSGDGGPSFEDRGRAGRGSRIRACWKRERAGRVLVTALSLAARGERLGPAEVRAPPTRASRRVPNCRSRARSAHRPARRGRAPPRAAPGKFARGRGSTCRRSDRSSDSSSLSWATWLRRSGRISRGWRRALVRLGAGCQSLLRLLRRGRRRVDGRRRCDAGARPS